MSITTGFLVGTDQSVVIINQSNNTQVQLDGKRRMMTSEAKDTLLESDVIDAAGVTDHRQIPGGYSGSIECEKSNANFSALVKFMDAAYYAGFPQTYFTIVETIRPSNPTQSFEVNTFVDAVFHGYKPGQWSKKQITMATIQFAAAQRV